MELAEENCFSVYYL